MNLAYTVEEVAGYTAHQLNAFFPDGRAVSSNVLKEYAQQALDRTEFCFRRVALRSYCDDGQAKFDLLHSDQYCSYLCLVANGIERSGGDRGLAAKGLYLNKGLHA